MLELINDLSFETVSNLTTLYDQETVATHRIYSINRPGRLLNFWTLKVGAYSRLGAY